MPCGRACSSSKAFDRAVRNVKLGWNELAGICRLNRHRWRRVVGLDCLLHCLFPFCARGRRALSSGLVGSPFGVVAVLVIPLHLLGASLGYIESWRFSG